MMFMIAVVHIAPVSLMYFSLPPSYDSVVVSGFVVLVVVVLLLLLLLAASLLLLLMKKGKIRLTRNHKTDNTACDRAWPHSLPLIFRTSPQKTNLTIFEPSHLVLVSTMFIICFCGCCCCRCCCWWCC